VIALLSFFGSSPWEQSDWLFTSRGRLALLLVALGIMFWPHIVEWLKGRWLHAGRVSRRRLVREADGLAADLLAYSASSNSSARSIREHFETTRKMQAASSEEEKSRIWNESTIATVQQYSRETNELRLLEGGRLGFVLGEFERRGVITATDRGRIEWMATSSAHWAGQAASELRAAARRVEPRLRLKKRRSPA
jgi:hypothetical protein